MGQFAIYQDQQWRSPDLLSLLAIGLPKNSSLRWQTSTLEDLLERTMDNFAMEIANSNERMKYKVDSMHKCKVKQIHLFPTFAELEHGLAPSTAEMAVFVECGVPIYFAYPQYFDIDTRSEKIRVNTTDHWYQQKHRHRRDVPIYHCDISKIRPQTLNLGYFGKLAEEIVELVDDENLETSNQQPESVCQITTQFQMIEFAEKLKKDCILAQNIMSDLDKFCNSKASEQLKKEVESDYVEGFWSLNNADLVSNEFPQDSDIHISDPKGNNYRSLSQEISSNEENFIDEQASSTNEISLLDYEDDFLSLPIRYSRSSPNENCDEYLENLSYTNTEPVMIKNPNKTAQNTNPFLENFHNSSFEDKSLMTDLVLNPNNPFLTYRLDKESANISNSTEYGSAIQEVKFHCWSTEDNRAENTSNFETLSSHSSSTGSLLTNSKGSCAITTQSSFDNINNNNDLSEVDQCSSNAGLHVQSGLLTPVMHTCNPQNWTKLNDNYSECTNYPPHTTMYKQYHSYGQPIYSESILPFRYQYAQPQFPTEMPFKNEGYCIPVPYPYFSPRISATGTLRPPPGFASNSNLYQVSSITQTTISSNLVGDGNFSRDFYDFYNAKLKLALESAANSAAL